MWRLAVTHVDWVPKKMTAGCTDGHVLAARNMALMGGFGQCDESA